MVKKSLNRFYIFGLALMAALYFFGVQPDQPDPQRKDTRLTEQHDSFHSPIANPLPFELEKKEEQPTSEDDDSKESKSGVKSNNSDSVAFLKEFCTPSNDDVVSRSQTEYHTPVYVRFRSILI